jgi:hypothetical protein
MLKEMFDLRLETGKLMAQAEAMKAETQRLQALEAENNRLREALQRLGAEAQRDQQRTAAALAALEQIQREVRAQAQAAQQPAAPQAATVPNLAGATFNAPVIIIVGDNNRVPPLPEDKEA